MQSQKILFNQNGNSKAAKTIQDKVSDFSDSYHLIKRKIIGGSVKLDEKAFRENVATLMPAFGMTRRGVFHGINCKSVVLDVCWKQFGKEFEALKIEINKNSSIRSRAILEVRKEIIGVTADLFDRLEWTETSGSDIGRVGASKMLFSIFPEIALPVDNSEWDNVFRTHDYGKILQRMVDEIRLWEDKSKVHLDILDTNTPTTLPSIYNVMAMDARPPKTEKKS
ncbi:MAG: hypothetical protein ABSF65_12375 [Candidatus Bathyarchaeia archaeon]|jgi:hypothetical protein